MRLQFVSDIHLEFGHPFNPPVTGDAIALLGDIGFPHTAEYKMFVQECADLYKHVFVVAGNHEYYRRQKTHDYTRELLHEFCSTLDNVHFLDDSAVVIDGVRFVGGTLWTHLDGFCGPGVELAMTDYKEIRKMALTHDGKPRKINISWHDTYAWHTKTVQYIAAQIKEAQAAGQRVVVLTHHVPTLDPRSHEGSQHGSDNPAYSTDLDHMIAKPVVLWAYGHTHWCSDFELDGVRVASNPRGYPGENTGGFDASKYIEL